MIIARNSSINFGGSMKTTLLTISLLFSVAAIAGPEDHIYDSCYTASEAVLPELPSNYCFEEVKLDLNSNRIDFAGYAMNVPDSLKVVSSYKKNDNTIVFVAKETVVNIWVTGCGEGKLAELIVTGEANTEGKINSKALNFTINYSLRADTCHSSPTTGAIEYKLSK
jgi:hypothetical protein